MAAKAPSALKISLMIICLIVKGRYAEDLGDIKFIKYYEHLAYDRNAVHQRVKRHLQGPQQELQLDFEGFHRAFHLRLKQDVGGFTDDFKVQSGNESWAGELSHIYSGVLEDESGSSCQGSIIEGQFEGSIKTSNGTFYVESVNKYTNRQADHHSIMYHEDDVDDSLLGGGGRAGFCGSAQLKNLIQTLRQEEPVSRAKRTVDQAKTSCLLHLHVDHLFYQKFGSIEGVVAQVIQKSNMPEFIQPKGDPD